MSASVDFLGLDFEPIHASQLADRLAGHREPSDSFAYLVTPNVDHMVRLDREPALRSLYENADLVVNDSRVLAFLASRDGLALPAAPGADIVAEIFRKHIDPNEPVNLIGGSFAVMHRLRTRFGLRRINWHQPPMGLREDPRAVARCAEFMAAHPARFHFLAVGSPQQEMVAWAAKLRGDVKGWGLCCGASLDFLAEETARAPQWIQGMGLEWLHRLVSQPRRMFKRYVIDGPRIFSIWQKWRKSQIADGNGAAEPG